MVLDVRLADHVERLGFDRRVVRFADDLGAGVVADGGAESLFDQPARRMTLAKAGDDRIGIELVKTLLDLAGDLLVGYFDGQALACRPDFFDGNLRRQFQLRIGICHYRLLRECQSNRLVSA